MQIGMIEGHTRIIGKSQGYLGLPLRDIRIPCTVNGPATPAMETAWLPTPAELHAIAQGAPIILRVIGEAHPPVMIETGLPPDPHFGQPGEIAAFMALRDEVKRYGDQLLAEAEHARETGMKEVQFAATTGAAVISQVLAMIGKIAFGAGAKGQAHG